MRRLEFPTHNKAVGVSILLMFFVLSFLLIFTEIQLKEIKNLRAQLVVMSLAMHSVPSITTSEGDVITPTQSESNQFEAATEETFIFVRPDDSSIEIVFFIGTTQLTLDLFIDAYENIPPIADDRPLPAGKSIAGGVIYEIRAFKGATEITTFDAPFAVNFHYLEEHIAGFIEETLSIYFWDESQSIWTAPTVTSRDTLQNIISVLIDHLTLFVLLGEKEDTSVSQVVGGGGGFSFVYPLPTEEVIPPKEPEEIVPLTEEVIPPIEPIEGPPDPLRQGEDEASIPEGLPPPESIGEEPPPPTKELPSQLFDINIEIGERSVPHSGELISRVIFTNFGTEPTSVELTFTLLNESGEEIYSAKESIVVENEAVLTKKFDTLDLDSGTYTLLVHTLYNVDVEEEFVQRFRVIKEERARGIFIISTLFLFAFIIGFFLLMKNYYIRKKIDHVK